MSSESGKGGFVLRGCVVENLQPGAQYRFRVAGINTAGQGPWSDYSYTVAVAPALPEAPSAPTAIATSLHSITYHWIMPEDSGAAIEEFRLFLSHRKDFPVLLHRYQTTYMCEGLEPGKSYQARVQARNCVGWSPLSEASDADSCTTQISVPDTPTPLIPVDGLPDSLQFELLIPNGHGCNVTRIVLQMRELSAFMTGEWGKEVSYQVPKEVELYVPPVEMTVFEENSSMMALRRASSLQTKQSIYAAQRRCSVGGSGHDAGEGEAESQSVNTKKSIKKKYSKRESSSSLDSISKDKNNTQKNKGKKQDVNDENINLSKDGKTEKEMKPASLHDNRTDSQIPDRSDASIERSEITSERSLKTDSENKQVDGSVNKVLASEINAIATFTRRRSVAPVGLEADLRVRFWVKGLKPDTIYESKVRAENKAGLSLYSILSQRAKTNRTKFEDDEAQAP
eukprot:CAMPEP_0182434822 /NCGR_PEP_ID=MMETSP1167-20130531/72010_1 /TAXON_ID=2988 /ORGANISM="Mallomonas Sp, Strain CCMP3275" /LENGTH=453 /DNA_ID=CAMNT_0024625119 /DNA_START=213 /DNA_END=1574 /DNA_ORIENTATION=-